VVLSQTATIRALPLASFVKELEERWGGLRDALNRSDVMEALECIHSQRRDQERGNLEKLAKASAKERADVFVSLTDFRLETPNSTAVLLRAVSPGAWVEVYFDVDSDGEWRIRQF
jgi:hypothetical protein